MTDRKGDKKSPWAQNPKSNFSSVRFSDVDTNIAPFY